MATKVTGPLKLVTDRAPENISVLVAVRELRPHGGGAVIPEFDAAEVSGGQVTFTAIPGPAVLSIVGGEAPVDAIELVIPDTGSASLETCIRTANMSQGETRRDVEELAAIAAASIEETRAAILTARGSEAAATKAASAAATSAGSADAARTAAEKAAAGAKTSEGNAAGSVTAARDSATAAAASAKTAGDSAAAAATSKTGAESAKAAADASKTAAAGSAKAASDSATAAAGSAGTATTQAGRAKTEADRAADIAATGVPDATASTKGKLQLAGDLAGTADKPTVPGLANKADKAHTHNLKDLGGKITTAQLPDGELLKSGTMGLTDSADTYKETGAYYQFEMYNGESSGLPFTGRGVLLVDNADGYISQTYIATDERRAAVRTYDGSWSAWAEFSTTGHHHTTAEVDGLATLIAQRAPSVVVSALPTYPVSGTIYFVTE